MAERRTRATEVWLDDLDENYGRARFEQDYADRERFMPHRVGGATRIERQDFAVGWIAMAVRSNPWAYFNDAGRARLGGPPAKAGSGRP